MLKEFVLESTVLLFMISEVKLNDRFQLIKWCSAMVVIGS